MNTPALYGLQVHRKRFSDRGALGKKVARPLSARRIVIWMRLKFLLSGVCHAGCSDS